MPGGKTAAWPSRQRAREPRNEPARSRNEPARSARSRGAQRMPNSFCATAFRSTSRPCRDRRIAHLDARLGDDLAPGTSSTPSRSSAPRGHRHRRRRPVAAPRRAACIYKLRSKSSIDASYAARGIHEALKRARYRCFLRRKGGSPARLMPVSQQAHLSGVQTCQA